MTVSIYDIFTLLMPSHSLFVSLLYSFEYNIIFIYYIHLNSAPGSLGPARVALRGD